METRGGLCILLVRIFDRDRFYDWPESIIAWRYTTCREWSWGWCEYIPSVC